MRHSFPSKLRQCVARFSLSSRAEIARAEKSLRTPEAVEFAVSQTCSVTTDVAQTLVSAAPRLISAFPTPAVTPEEGRDESRPGRQECLRHEDRLTSNSTASGGLGAGRHEGLRHVGKDVTSQLTETLASCARLGKLKQVPRCGVTGKVL